MHDFNLFADIKKLLIESHTKEEIKALSTSELKKLHGEYLAKGTEEAKEEAAEIKKEIESRGEEKDETIEEQVEELHEIEGRRKPYKRPTTTEFLARLKKQQEEEAKKKAEAEAEKPDVAQQNEELLVILDVLCEMVGLDMVALVEETLLEFDPNRGKAGRKIPLARSFLDAHNQELKGAEKNAHKRFASLPRSDQERFSAYSSGRRDPTPDPYPQNARDYQTGSDVARSPDVEADRERRRRASIRAAKSRRAGSTTYVGEETRKEMEDLGHAYGWDQPAPEGVMARTDRLARVKENMARLGKRKDRGTLKAGEETAYRIEMGGEDLVHEPTAKERAKGAPSARVDPKGYDKVQDSIEKISDKFTMKRARQNAFDAMKPFALQPKPKGKGKGKK